MMSDRRAYNLLILLGDYMNDSIAEGDTVEGAGDYTLREIANDLVATVPAHMTIDLPAPIAELTKGDE